MPAAPQPLARDLSTSRPASLHSVPSRSKTQWGAHGANGDGEKHFTRGEINEVTRAEQNHGQLKNFSMLSLVGLAYCILNSWTAMAASLSVVLPSGGPVAMLWGLVIAAIGNLAMAASLSEIVHVFPTSGGPYHFAHILSPPEWAPLISWVVGWFAWAGWTALTATTGSLAGELLIGMWALAHPGFEEQPYQIFVIFTGFIVIATLINIYASRLLPYVNSSAIIWSLTGAATIIIVTLACASPDYQSGNYVFRTYTNTTGWNRIDALSHLVEEVPRPHINIPRAMILAVLIGASSSWVFLMVLLFVMKDPDAVVSSSAGALLETMYQATGNVAGAICLQVFPLVSMEFAAQGILCAASRMTHAFARDHGLPFSRFLSKLNSRTSVPDRAILLTSFLCICFALIYLGSSAAFNAILSSSVVFLNISYCVPIALLLIRGRHLLRPESFPSPTWTLGPILGPIANVVALCFTAVTSVFFLFPPEAEVTGSSMNYAVAVFGLIAIVSIATWFLQGRKSFSGPRDLGGLLELARAEVNRDELSRPATRSGSRSASRSRAREGKEEA
ncbi:hypothetical protein Rhopal_002981-T1 [Rhodotorula paludigena]|uniref:Choline transporter n=1 Tax=Rhodotorula paludigena TaxID=86838 RepID=A0AAV5GLS3_9BASI|nr:hypothetical protein Rhopal_002981-T1 [Rhodotorula paludigena]